MARVFADHAQHIFPLHDAEDSQSRFTDALTFMFKNLGLSEDEKPRWRSGFPSAYKAIFLLLPKRDPSFRQS